MPKWWLPERWVFIDEVPKTTVGKFDKKVLRARHADGEFEVIEVDIARPLRMGAELAGRLSGIGEDLADRPRPVAPDADTLRAGGEPDPAVRRGTRITRARRAVDKAATLLGGSPAGGFDEGP